MNKIHLLIATTIAVIFILPFYFIKKERSLEKIDCSGDMSFFKDNMAMELTSRFNMDGSEGIIYMNGRIISDDKTIGIINRAIKFKSVKVKQGTVLTSKEIIPSIDEKLNASLGQVWLPDFYLKKGGSVNIYLDAITFNSILISGWASPYYVCIKY